MADPVAVGEYPGIRIEYHESPRRMYTINGERVPSVTTVLGLLDKSGPLVGWATRITVEGAWKMIHRKGYTIPGDVTAFKHDLKRFGYDHRSQTKAAADRGVDVHAVLQDWAEQQKIPNASDYPEDRRGYIRGLAKWLMDWQPKFVASELVVGSAEHGFAGRLDTVAVIEHEDRGRVMCDLKTSKGIYPNTMFCQLAAYELASVECGLEPTEAQCIIRVGADGSWEPGWSDASADDFLAVLAAYRSQQKWAKR